MRMLEYLLKKTGLNEEQVRLEMMRDHIIEAQDKTLMDFVDAEHDDDDNIWYVHDVDDPRCRVTLQQIADTLNPDSPVAKPAAPRMTPKEVEELQRDILNFFQDGEHAPIGDIAEAVELPTDKVRTQLAKLVEKGLIAKHGDRRYMTYSKM